MQHKVLKHLFDIKESINSIYTFLGEDRNFNTYKSDKLLRRAVERELEIIGEATSKILKIDENIDIKDARRIVNLRNLIIHGYDKVDDIIIWGVIVKYLPELKEQVSQLLKND